MCRHQQNNEDILQAAEKFFNGVKFILIHWRGFGWEEPSLCKDTNHTLFSDVKGKIKVKIGSLNMFVVVVYKHIDCLLSVNLVI